jgi:hypothetical protein
MPNHKETLKNISAGILVLVIAGIFLQAILSLGGERIPQLGLGGVLGLMYVFLAVQAAGYWLTALGTKKLTRIERI